MPETPRSTEVSEQLNRLQKRVGSLEWQLRATTAISGLGAAMVGGATLLLVGLALPWMGPEGRAEFGSLSQSGWTVYAAEPVGLLVLLAMLVLVGLTVATAASRSPKLHLATHILADLACLPSVGLLLSALREGSSVVPRSGCYTMLVGALTIAVAAWVRRGQLET